MTFETRLTPAMTARHVAAGHWGRETFHDVLTESLVLSEDFQHDRVDGRVRAVDPFR
jgi:hypothetical protein